MPRKSCVCYNRTHADRWRIVESCANITEVINRLTTRVWLRARCKHRAMLINIIKLSATVVVNPMVPNGRSQLRPNSLTVIASRRHLGPACIRPRRETVVVDTCRDTCVVGAWEEPSNETVLNEPLARGKGETESGKWGGEPVQTRVRNGFLSNYKLSHGWRRSAAELTPGLAFPVNAAANQTRLQSPPFSSFRPATLTRAARVSLLVLFLSPSLASLYLSPPAPHHSYLSMSIPLCFSPSSSHSSFPLFPPFSRLPRRFVPWSFRFLSARMEGSKNSTRRRIAAGGLGICMRGIYNWAMFILCRWNYHRCNYGEPRKR